MKSSGKGFLRTTSGGHRNRRPRCCEGRSYGFPWFVLCCCISLSGASWRVRKRLLMAAKYALSGIGSLFHLSYIVWKLTLSHLFSLVLDPLVLLLGHSMDGKSQKKRCKTSRGWWDTIHLHYSPACAVLTRNAWVGSRQYPQFILGGQWRLKKQVLQSVDFCDSRLFNKQKSHSLGSPQLHPLSPVLKPS